MKYDSYIENESPLVSVIIPTYNRAYILKESILSVLNQTYNNIEVIVVDDYSSDDTEKVVLSMVDHRITFVRNEKNFGTAESRNIGAKLAKGEYLAFNDSDDLWLPDKIESQIRGVLETDCDISYGYLKRSKAFDHDNSEIIPQNGTSEELSGYLHKKLLVNNFIALPTLLIKKDLFISVGGFNSELRSVEDYEFLLRVTKENKVIFVDKILVDSRDFGDGINSFINNSKEVCDGLLYIIDANYNEIKTENIEFRLKVILEKASSWLDRTEYEKRAERIMKYADRKAIEDLRYIRQLRNDSITLSIILPFYNSEKYIEESLTSVTAMKFTSIEIICINDGSSDASTQIVEKFAERDPRIVCINKERTGYGNSVNLGLEIARGKYIGIIESDDIADPDGFRKLIEVANATNADIIKGNYSVFSNDRSTATKFENLANMPYYRLFDLKYAPMLAVTAPAIWSGIYRRDFLLRKKIQLLNSPGASYQDTAFAFITFVAAQSIYLIEDNIVFYRADNEMSSSNRNNKVFDIFNETDYMKEYLIANKLEKFLPLLARTKMQGQAWNYNRIEEAKKKEFMLKWHIDAIVDYIHGTIKRDYWDDESWVRINNVIFNPYYYVKNTQIGDFTIKEQIIAILKEIDKVYIIGIGSYALLVYNRLSVYDISISAFVCDKDTSECVDQIMGIPVVNLENIDRDSLLLQGVLPGDTLLTKARNKYYTLCDLYHHLADENS